MNKVKSLVLCGILMLCLSACGVKIKANEEIKNNQGRAIEIINALTRYEQEHGRFPDQLDLLVPAYLAQIPITSSGKDFSCELDTLEGFYLTFYLDSDETLACSYNQRLKGWDCSRGD